MNFQRTTSNGVVRQKVKSEKKQKVESPIYLFIKSHYTNFLVSEKQSVRYPINLFPGMKSNLTLLQLPF